MFLQLVYLLLYDAVFVGVIALLVIPLAVYRRAAFAVLRRNFVSYFSNPTGYVFLCLFVLLTSFAAFWPHEFFASNMANLNQLNRYMPYIMLIFIPAITMSIWAEERRQGTDELLLTLPAGDFDIVIGKFLAAAAIFSASLLFSQLSNYSVLIMLTKGDLDTGLLMATYLGYWFMGMAMLSLGMVASFLTSNLTVGFIIGMVFNAPLAFLSEADTIISGNSLARSISQWGILAHFDDFGRGVISPTSVIYFAMIVVLGLYLSMVLIGRRHWLGGKDGTSMLGHYLVRALCMGVIAVAVIAVSAYPLLGWLRTDVTEGKISSPSRESLRLIREIDPKTPVFIDAFVSAEVPDEYVETRYNLITMLKEFDKLGGNNIRLNLRDDLDRTSEETKNAEETFGIRAVPLRTRDRGAIVDQEVVMGAAFRCGLEKVVVPFFDYGVPVEYELVRSIGTVARKKKSRLGVVQTDAHVNGGFVFGGMQPQQVPKQEIIEELEKQYEVESIDPAGPIDVTSVDAMLLVQPSSLNQQGLNNVMDAIRAGLPTAILEDPRPIFLRHIPGTGDPKRGGMGGMGGMGGGMEPKCQIGDLWDLLGLEVPGVPGPTGFSPEIVWQSYNPYPQLKLQASAFNDSWVFASPFSAGGQNALNVNDKVTSGLLELLLPVPGVIQRREDSKLKFTKLVSTGEQAGTMPYDRYMQTETDPELFRFLQGKPSGKSQVIAARIEGTPDSDTRPATPAEGPEGSEDAAEKDSEAKPINVIYVADVDIMFYEFLRIRARPGTEGDGIRWRIENVTFLLNMIDSLSGDDQYISIRKRKPHHSTLRTIEERTEGFQAEQMREREEMQEEFTDLRQEAEKEREKLVEKANKEYEEILKRREAGEQIDPNEFLAIKIRKDTQAQIAEKRFEVKVQALERDREKKLKDLEQDYEQDVRRDQYWFKAWAVGIPPIPPLIVGFVVYLSRLLREREGVSTARLR